MSLMTDEHLAQSVVSLQWENSEKKPFNNIKYKKCGMMTMDPLSLKTEKRAYYAKGSEGNFLDNMFYLCPHQRP